MKTLILLGRPGCQHCDDWEDRLHEYLGGRFFLDWRDVDRNPDWRERYGARIPVLLDESAALLCAGDLDLGIIEQYLSAEARPV